MSPRLVIVIVLAGAVAAGAGIFMWVFSTSSLSAGQAPGATTFRSASDTERHAHRDTFFSGAPERDIRGGQEMKPRW